MSKSWNETQNTLLVSFSVVGILLIVINIFATYFIVDMKSQSIADKTIEKYLALEYDKVGGKANYEKINEITKGQVEAGLQQYEAEGWSAAQAPEQAAPTPAPTGDTISLEVAKKVTQEGTYILGNPDAEISFVEYSDLECPFCQRLHKSGTIDQVLENYDGKVNFIFKQFPLDFHPQAPMEAEAALCVWSLAGGEMFYSFIDEVFDKSKANGRSFTKETISELGETIGVDKNKLLTCIESGDFKAEAQRQMTEWSTLFGITGTPGNVLINNKTGDWDKLPGAYPYESFKQKIDGLLEK